VLNTGRNCFFQAGLEHFGGQVAPLDTQWVQTPALADVAEATPHSSVDEQPDTQENIFDGGQPPEPVTRSVYPSFTVSSWITSITIFERKTPKDRYPISCERGGAVTPHLSMSQISSRVGGR
jgi:hypothetical protein